MAHARFPGLPGAFSGLGTGLEGTLDAVESACDKNIEQKCDEMR